MQIINGVRQLKPKHMKEFLNSVKDNENIYVIVNDNPMEEIFNKQSLRKSFESNDIQLAIKEDSDSVMFMSDNACLDIAGIDYKWHNEDVSRLDKLFGIRKKKEKEEQSSSLLCVACCQKENGEIKNLKTFEGTKKQVVEFMNREYADRLLHSNFTAEVAFNVAYENEVELRNIDNYLTLEELAGIGLIEIEEK